MPEQCLLRENEFMVENIFAVAEGYDEINNFPVEFLNSLTPIDMPVHCLNLKIGAVIMLLRNLDLKARLHNRFQLMLCALKKKLH